METSYNSEIYEDQQFLDLMQRQLDNSDTLQQQHQRQQQFLSRQTTGKLVMQNMHNPNSFSNQRPQQYQPQYRQQQPQQQQHHHHKVNFNEVYYHQQPIGAVQTLSPSMTEQELMPQQEQQQQLEQPMVSYCAADSVYDQYQEMNQISNNNNNNSNGNPYQHPHYQLQHQSLQQPQQQQPQQEEEYINTNDCNNIYYVPSQQQPQHIQHHQLRQQPQPQQSPHVAVLPATGNGMVGVNANVVGLGGDTCGLNINADHLINDDSQQSLLQPLQHQQQHQHHQHQHRVQDQGAEELLLESLGPSVQLPAEVSPSTATTELTMGSYGTEVFEEHQYLDMMQSQLEQEEPIQQHNQKQHRQQIMSRPVTGVGGGGQQYNMQMQQNQQLQYQQQHQNYQQHLQYKSHFRSEQPKPMSQLDFIDTTNNRPRISQDWLDMICRHMIEHMNNFGICVIDDFLGPLKGDMILKEVQQLYSSGIYTEGRLVGGGSGGGSNSGGTSYSSGNSKHQQQQARNGTNNNSIRSDRVIWIDGYEPGCTEINNLIQTLCSVISNSSRLSLYTNNDLDKNIINRRTKAHVACYPANGTRYIKHVDNPNGDGRVITAIYYLNKNWNTKCDGGLLRMFPAGMDTVANIEPLFDRVIFFWSDRRNPHEVLPAYRDRFAITVWYIGESRQQ